MLLWFKLVVYFAHKLNLSV